MAKKQNDKIFTPEELQGKFIVGYDTIAQGNLCVTTTDEKKRTVPYLFDSYEEAYKEVFESHIGELESQEEDEDTDISKKTFKKIPQMYKLLKEGNIDKMKEFLDKNQDCELSEEFIEKAEDFIFGRKVFLPSGVTGIKLVELTHKIVKETM